jgi:hypothetical protein
MCDRRECPLRIQAKEKTMMGRHFKPARRVARPQQGSLQRSWRTASWLMLRKAALPEQPMTLAQAVALAEAAAIKQPE